MKKLLALPLALSISLSLVSMAHAQAINAHINGQVIQSGTYLNTAGNKTIFQNTAGTGIDLPAGNRLIGLESNASGTLTGNGGAVEIYAPGQVVRLDGNIYLNAGKSGSGFVGNGGQLYIQAGFLLQNGAIYANGRSGGSVFANVGSAIYGPKATVEAIGYNGAGGTIQVSATGVVDINSGARLFTKGQPIFSANGNTISITGGVVNNNGIIKAAGLDGTGQSGGRIELVATANPATDAVGVINGASGVLLSGAEAAADSANITYLATHSTTAGSVINHGDIIADGATDSSAPGAGGGNGGTLIVSAANNFISPGYISVSGGNSMLAQGGNGGSVVLSATNNIMNGKTIRVVGGDSGITLTSAIEPGIGFKGGNGGTLAIFTKNFHETANAKINLNGGSGGMGSILGGNGGNGGLLKTDITVSALNDGYIYANGGNGGDGVSSGGLAGSLVQNGISITNDDIIQLMNGLPGL